MRIVTLMSGGLDSSVLAAHLKYLDHEVLGLSVFYGQRHSRELASAEAVANELGIPIEEIDLGQVRRILKGSSQTDETVPVPHGHYAAENMKSTVVPNRNMLLLACAGAYAISVGAERIAYAAHAGDHPIYADCRPEFIESCAQTIFLASDGKVQLWAPFQNKTKADIVTLGKLLQFNFANTWSCYEGGDIHCGKCGTCVERKEAFVLAGVDDPTIYPGTSFNQGRL